MEVTESSGWRRASSDLTYQWASLMDVGCFCAGLHCESGVWSMLFGLLMWDCLFTDIPDTLRTQFQLAPLDLNTPHFYEVAALAMFIC